jgi:hypothetical protein
MADRARNQSAVGLAQRHLAQGANAALGNHRLGSILARRRRRLICAKGRRSDQPSSDSNSLGCGFASSGAAGVDSGRNPGDLNQVLPIETSVKVAIQRAED